MPRRPWPAARTSSVACGAAGSVRDAILVGIVLAGVVLFVFLPIMFFYSPLLTFFVVAFAVLISAWIVLQLPNLRKKSTAVFAVEGEPDGSPVGVRPTCMWM